MYMKKKSHLKQHQSAWARPAVQVALEGNVAAFVEVDDVSRTGKRRGAWCIDNILVDEHSVNPPDVRGKRAIVLFEGAPGNLDVAILDGAIAMHQNHAVRLLRDIGRIGGRIFAKGVATDSVADDFTFEE